MISVISLPEKISSAINKSSNEKRRDFLKKFEDIVKLLFYRNSLIVYNDVINHPLFDSFCNSFLLIGVTNKEIKYFVNEEIFNENVGIDKFENNLFEGQIQTRKQEQYINRVNKLKADVRLDFEMYLEKDFWNEFDKEKK